MFVWDTWSCLISDNLFWNIHSFKICLRLQKVEEKMKSPSFKMMKRNETEEKGGERIDRAKQIAILLSDYQNLIFSLCYQMTQNYFEAEDLAQETFVAA